MTAKKICSYDSIARDQSPKNKGFVLATGTDNSAGSRSPHLSTACHTTHSTPQLPTPAPPNAAPYVNLLHLELFQNVASNAISLTYFADGSSKDQWVATVLRVSLT